MTSVAARRVAATVAGAEAGRRLDLWLAERLPDLSRTRIKALVDAGRIRVDDAPALKASRRLRPGERVEAEIPSSPPEEMVPEAIPLAIVFEDDEVLVVDKPAGIVTHRIVHRLDKGTSGLIALAKTSRAYDSLTAQLQRRAVSRRYLCLAHGAIRKEEGVIDAPIARDPRSRVRMAVARAGTGRRAVTRFRVLERFRAFTFLECRLETGRTHQIRVHLASIGHPLLGDETYGGRRARSDEALSEDLVEGLGGVALHAAGLSFLHPVTGEPVELASPLPNRIVRVLSHLRPR